MEKEVPPGSYIFRPTEWERTCSFFRLVSDFTLALLDLYAIFCKCLEKKTRADDAPRRSMSVQTETATISHPKKQDSHNALMKWLPKISRDPNMFYPYSSIWEAVESIPFSCSFCSHAKRCARIIINDSNKCMTNKKIVDTVRSIKRTAERSIKFRHLFKSLIQLLDDIELSDTDNLTKFLKALAVEMLQVEDSFALQYAINYFRSFNQKSQSAYETTLATAALFIHEGAGFEKYLLMGGWRNPRDTRNAGLTLIMYLATQACGASCDKESNVVKFTGFDRILFSHMDRPFVRWISRSATKTDRLFKDKIMYDISLNFCNEYIEASWSNEKIERAVWGLQYGLKYFNRETYEELQSMNGKHKLDLTGYEPASLLAFSICGAVYFQGRNECAYKLTGDPEALIVINGSLPKPTIRDLLELSLLNEARKGRYTPKLFPGRSKYVKATRVGNTLRLIESVRNVTFNATEEQMIC